MFGPLAARRWGQARGAETPGSSGGGYTMKNDRKLWLRIRWFVLAAAAVAFVSFVLEKSWDITQSRWDLTRKPGLYRFVEKQVPRNAARAFSADFPAGALSWLSDRGIDGSAIARRDLVVFGAWGDFMATGTDDRLVLGTLKPAFPSELRTLDSVSHDFNAREPWSALFASGDGVLVFLDLESAVPADSVHALVHVLSYRNTPRLVLDRIDASRAVSFSEMAQRDYDFLVEAAARFFGDLRAARVVGNSGGDLARYAAYVAATYEGATAPGEDDLPYAEAARFSLGLAKERGLDGATAVLAAYVNGNYVEIDGPASPLGGDLPSLLSRYVGTTEVPRIGHAVMSAPDGMGAPRGGGGN